MAETMEPASVDGSDVSSASGAPAEGGAPDKPVRRRRKAVVPDLPLGSLSQPQIAVDGPTACPDCSSLSLTRLVVASPVGVPAVFVSCHDCERSGSVVRSSRSA